MNLQEIILEIQFYGSHAHVATAVILTIIFTSYLWFVLYGGPKMMEKREPYKLTGVLRGYNVFQIVVCTGYAIRAYQLGFTFEFLFTCQNFGFLSDSAKREVLTGSWLFLVLRICEFSETIVFVLRKKKNDALGWRISIHIGNVLTSWLFILSGAQWMAVYIALVSSITNVFMYSFYLIASFPKPIIQLVMNKLKFLLSLVQFAQLIVIIAHCIIAILPSCNSGYFFHLQLVHFLASGFVFGKFFITNVHMKDVKAEKMLKHLGDSWEEC